VQAKAREFCITVRNCGKQPDPAGRQAIDNFFNFLDANWREIFTALAGVDASLTTERIEACMQETVYLLAPALVGSQWHCLLITFDLSLPEPLLASCIICVDKGVVVSAEVQYKHSLKRQYSVMPSACGALI
jgi:hypothetical protein